MGGGLLVEVVAALEGRGHAAVRRREDADWRRMFLLGME